MPAWPGNPIASMTVTRVIGQDPPYQTFISPSSGSSNDTVHSSDIQFTVEIMYQDPNGLGDRGLFAAELHRKTPGGWVAIDLATKLLYGNAGNPSTVNDTLTLSAAMTDNTEEYRVFLRCGGDQEQTSELWPPLQLQASLNSIVGKLRLGFVVVAIVYCPPGQDMTNSLSLSRTFGTRFSLGFQGQLGGELSSVSSVYTKVEAGPVWEVNTERSSKTGITSSNDTVEISSTVNTIITADNQRAIGRAYWGPLGDQFVILTNLTFSKSKKSDGTLLYAPTLDGGEQILVVPAWKLLRPGDDPVAGSIPANDRRSILSVDPFIWNLDKFFPDSGADLSEAANPYCDPTSGNRAELVARWWLDTGTEVQYSKGNTYQQLFTKTSQLTNTVSLTDETLGNNVTKTTTSTSTIAYEESAETDSSTISNASCFLIKNQNDADLDGIAIYYDKIFSTFMFRRIRSLTPTGPAKHPKHKPTKRFEPWIWAAAGYGVVMGKILDPLSLPLRGVQAKLVSAKGEVLQTNTNGLGRFEFYNVNVGSYRLVVGDKQSQVTVAAHHSPLNPQRVDVNGVRRMINLRNAPLWEISEALRIPVAALQSLGKKLARVKNERSLLHVTGIDRATLQNLKRRTVFVWGSARVRPSQRLGANQTKKR